jgi:hypothetical protein
MTAREEEAGGWAGDDSIVLVGPRVSGPCDLHELVSVGLIGLRSIRSTLGGGLHSSTTVSVVAMAGVCATAISEPFPRLSGSDTAPSSSSFDAGHSTAAEGYLTLAGAASTSDSFPSPASESCSLPDSLSL